MTTILRWMLPLACLPLFAGEIATPPLEAPTSETAKIALLSLVAQQQELRHKIETVIAEECRSRLAVPDSKLDQCSISPDMAKVIWKKTTDPQNVPK